MVLGEHVFEMPPRHKVDDEPFRMRQMLYKSGSVHKGTLVHLADILEKTYPTQKRGCGEIGHDAIAERREEDYNKSDECKKLYALAEALFNKGEYSFEGEKEHITKVSFYNPAASSHHMYGSSTQNVGYTLDVKLSKEHYVGNLRIVSNKYHKNEERLVIVPSIEYKFATRGLFVYRINNCTEDSVGISLKNQKEILKLFRGLTTNPIDAKRCAIYQKAFQEFDNELVRRAAHKPFTLNLPTREKLSKQIAELRQQYVKKS